MPGLSSVVSLARTAVTVSVEIATAVAGRVIHEVRERTGHDDDGGGYTPGPAAPPEPPAPAAAPAAPTPVADEPPASPIEAAAEAVEDAGGPEIDVYDALPPEPLIDEPTPVEPDEIVAESADPGAADGAGATIRVDEPWDGYKEMTAPAIIDRVVVADAATLTAIRLYEGQHRKRKSLLAAVDKRFAAIS